MKKLFLIVVISTAIINIHALTMQEAIRQNYSLVCGGGNSGWVLNVVDGNIGLFYDYPQRKFTGASLAVAEANNKNVCELCNKVAKEFDKDPRITPTGSRPSTDRINAQPQKGPPTEITKCPAK